MPGTIYRGPPSGPSDLPARWWPFGVHPIEREEDAIDKHLLKGGPGTAGTGTGSSPKGPGPSESDVL